MRYAAIISSWDRALKRGFAALHAVALAALLTAPLAHALPFEITVMTRNLYFGADLGPLLQAGNVPALIGATTAAYGQVVASDPAARIARIADEITAAQPHVVGLQEAVLWRTRTPSGFAGPPGPEVVAYDFIQMLLDELGPAYKLAVKTQGFDGAAPGFLGGTLSDVRLTDRDAILVRDLPADQFQVLATGSDTFAAFISAPIAGGAGGSVDSLQTYAFVDIGVPGAQFRVTTTHLEPNVAPIQEAQGDELIAALGGVPLPQIVLGDFNSRADGLGTDTYANMLAAGFRDAWLEQGSGDGFTCCQAANLLNDPSALDQRIDFVFHRGRFETVRIDVIGEEPGDRAASGHWPSDHAGVLATLRLVPEPGTSILVLIALGAMTLTRRRACTS